MRSFVDASDIAATVAFLCSEAARLINGQVVAVDGHTETLRTAFPDEVRAGEVEFWGSEAASAQAGRSGRSTVAGSSAADCSSPWTILDGAKATGTGTKRERLAHGHVER